ncbi:MAG: restriction endonuclease [Desulfobulbaceae bacterium DB1]|nr:MAG: restriction endonuclease [Desulfobulbaceae bacterium DB1]
MARKIHDTLPFDTMLLEGALFVPDLLEKCVRGEHTGQRESDYHTPKGLKLHDEYGRAFQIALAQWQAFAPALSRQDIDQAAATRTFAFEFLRDALGYADLHEAGVIEISGRGYPVTLLACGQVPVVVAPCTLSLDDPDSRFAVAGSGSRRKSAFRLAQEFLNASVESTWALVTNGRELRLLRDAATLTRPSFLEFDLATILGAARYPDFAALWRILHSSRVGEPGRPGYSCIWEAWREEGRGQGTRVREGLRHGVTQALIALGEGFISHPANDSLRRALDEGALSTDSYFQELLRLVYRCLFLFTLEERELLHPGGDRPDGGSVAGARDGTGATDRPTGRPEAHTARTLYAEGYAVRRLRNRALRRTGFDGHDDLWQGLRIVFRSLYHGEPRLALPALGGLFAPEQCPMLDQGMLTNRALLTAMYHLRWATIDGALSPVDYRNMGPEELGSVYESLLELVPSVDLASRGFGFVGLTEEGNTFGNDRKKSGSYYTPDSLVQELIKSALDPVIEARLAARPDNPTEALLAISVIDPACGSGHFLLAAARRLAEKLTEFRAVDGAVKSEDFRHALREVIAHCIYGVDKNPMALELARTALWLEGYEPGRPLSFLDHHLVCGDALLGLTDVKQLAAGIADAAFKPLSGDDKALCRTLAQANRTGRRLLEKRQRGVSGLFAEQGGEDILRQLTALENMPDGIPAEVEAKKAAYGAFMQQARDSRLAHAADLLIGAFLAPKNDEQALATTPTNENLLVELFGGQGDPAHEIRLAMARQLCSEARVLHWPLAFAHLAQGGFDCVLANPPWERIKLQEEEFFATRHPEVAKAKNKAERGQRIQWLSQGMLNYHLYPELSRDDKECEAEQRLFAAFIRARRTAEAASIYAHLKGDEGGRFPLTGVGDVNTYALFAETISQISARDGRAGFIVPTGIATDDSTKAYFAHIAQISRLVSLFDFENREGLFPAVDSRMKFCLLTLGDSAKARFSFFLTATAQLADERRGFTLSPEDFRRINPNTRTCPVFRSRMDAELTRKIYNGVPVLIREAGDDGPEENPWGISFMRMLDMSNDSHLFADHDGDRHLPLYEAKMIHQFDHRWASYQLPSPSGRGAGGEGLSAGDVALVDKENPAFMVQPRYWVEKRQVLARLANVPHAMAQAYADDDGEKLLAALANWLVACHREIVTLTTAARLHENLLALAGPLFAALPQNPRDWLDERTQTEARNHPALTGEELRALRHGQDLQQAADTLMDGRSPRWLMGWRDICRATDERTVIASVLPRVGVGNNFPLMLFDQPILTNNYAALLGNLSALAFDFVARHKVGGTHLNYFIYKQLPVLPPDTYTETDLAFIVPRVLELTYTSHDMQPWAEDLGYSGPPFAFEPDRRAQLRAELDAYYGRLYNLTRDELRYILDPADVMGLDYPSETFRVLKKNEERQFCEYRTRRLVLAAWDSLENPLQHKENSCLPV